MGLLLSYIYKKGQRHCHHGSTSAGSRQWGIASIEGREYIPYYS